MKPKYKLWAALTMIDIANDIEYFINTWTRRMAVYKSWLRWKRARLQEYYLSEMPDDDQFDYIRRINKI